MEVREIDDKGVRRITKRVTAQKATAVLAALFADFITHQDLRALHNTAARVEAARELIDTNDEITTTKIELADRRVSLREQRRRARVLTLIASGAELPTSPRQLLHHR